MAQWLVGVDAGGTRTRAATLAPDGTRSEGAAEGANWTVHGPDLCRERITAAVTQALPSGAVPGGVCLAIAGYYPPDHQAAAEPWAQGLWPESAVTVVPDVVAAWAGALGGEPGIVVISGTGSICYGRNAQGEEARAGGWGPLFGDQGSAYWVGVRCLATLSDHVDWRTAPTRLSQGVMARWPELGSDLRTWLRGIYRQGWGREQIAELASEVARLADEGELESVAIVVAAAYQLAEQARATAVSLGKTPLPVILQGGLGRGCRELQDEFRSRVQTQDPPLELKDPLYTPLEGALLQAGEAWNGKDGLRSVQQQLRAD